MTTPGGQSSTSTAHPSAGGAAAAPLRLLQPDRGKGGGLCLDSGNSGKRLDSRLPAEGALRRRAPRLLRFHRQALDRRHQRPTRRLPVGGQGRGRLRDPARLPRYRFQAAERPKARPSSMHRPTATTPTSSPTSPWSVKTRARSTSMTQGRVAACPKPPSRSPVSPMPARHCQPHPEDPDPSTLIKNSGNPPAKYVGETKKKKGHKPKKGKGKKHKRGRGR